MSEPAEINHIEEKNADESVAPSERYPASREILITQLTKGDGEIVEVPSSQEKHTHIGISTLKITYKEDPKEDLPAQTHFFLTMMDTTSEQPTPIGYCDFRVYPDYAQMGASERYIFFSDEASSILSDLQERGVLSTEGINNIKSDHFLAQAVETFPVSGDGIFIDQKYRGKGYGRILFELATDIAKMAGVKRYLIEMDTTSAHVPKQSSFFSEYSSKSNQYIPGIYSHEIDLENLETPGLDKLYPNSA